MKVYAEKTQPFFGRVFGRIANARKTYAPDTIELVDNPKQADLQIIDMVGPGEEFVLRAPKYALNIFCWKTCDSYTKSFLENAEVVFSTYNLPALDPTIKYNKFVMLPVGYDPELFFPLEGVQKKYGIITTGYVAETEAIDSCFIACRLLGVDMLHIGKDFGWGQYYVNKENITDIEMQISYNRSRFASALRVVEGFEVSGIEALACGVRPLVFDNPDYLYWYGDHARYITEVRDPRALGIEIAEAIKFPSLVSKEERDWVKENFSWEVVIKRFWKEVLE